MPRSLAKRELHSIMKRCLRWVLTCSLVLYHTAGLEQPLPVQSLHDAWFTWVNADAHDRVAEQAFQSALPCAPTSEVDRLATKSQQFMDHLYSEGIPPNAADPVLRAATAVRLMLAELGARQGKNPPPFTAGRRNCLPSRDSESATNRDLSGYSDKEVLPGLSLSEEASGWRSLLASSLAGEAADIAASGGGGATGVPLGRSLLDDAVGRGGVVDDAMVDVGSTASVTPMLVDPPLPGPLPESLPVDSHYPQHHVDNLQPPGTDITGGKTTRGLNLEQHRRSPREVPSSPDDAPAHVPAEDGALDLAYGSMIDLVRKRTTGWISQLSPNSTILVGNSQKLLAADPPLGDVINGYDDVIRFNSKRIAEYVRAIGSKTTVMVMGDFQWTCGCNGGECCNATQVAAFWSRVGDVRALLVSFKRFLHASVFKRGARPQGVSVHELGHIDCFEQDHPFDCSKLQYVRASMLNAWLDQKRAEGHRGLVSRIPWGKRIRTGTQTLMLLLFHGMVPTIAGYDLGCEQNHHFYESNHGAFRWYDHETPVVLDLVREGLVRALDVPSNTGTHPC
eukprot:jgi/Mesvir1/6126/Mv00830-RA.1